MTYNQSKINFSMEVNNKPNKTSIEDSNDSIKKGILAYDNNEKQTLFKFLGIELTAPKGLKNPRIIYISFILINLLLLILIKNIILN
ncbi:MULTISPECIES: hypothetical protein [Prochlorococcus]|nr:MULTISPECIES: hypothetical protein [Prochlorococcus]